MAMRAFELKSILTGLSMRGSSEEIAEASLVQISEREGRVAKLNGAVGSDPHELVRVTWHVHARALQRPVRNRADRFVRLRQELWIQCFQSEQFSAHVEEILAVGCVELEFAVITLREVRQ